jgi:hypothetical protein
MTVQPIMAAALAAVVLFCVGYIFYRSRTGYVRHGAVVYTRSEKPVEFWFSALFPPAALFLLAFSATTDMGRNDYRFDHSVLWLLGAILIGFLLIRALQTGHAGGPEISFARSEEPREFWLILLFYAAVEGLMLFMLFLVLSLPPR